jgi:hypothetical protein
VSRLQDNVLDALAEAEEALQLHKNFGDILGFHGDLYVLGTRTHRMGTQTERESSSSDYGDGRAYGNPTGITLSLDHLANEEIARGNPIKAMTLAGASEAIKESVGGEAPPELVDLPDLRDEARRVIREEEVRAAWDEGRDMSLDEAVAYAREDE